MPLQTQLIHSSSEPFFNILGPLTQFLVEPANASGAFGVLRSIVPPGVVIPLHSHADPEVLVIHEGALEFLQYDGNSSRWLTAQPSQIICIPGGVKHALRNSSPKPTTVLLITTPNIYGFFRQLGEPVEHGQSPAPPTAEDLQRLAALSAQHNYWLASREENAAIGLTGF
jgi:quercetin dioxygenase-like cupin family protein